MIMILTAYGIPTEIVNASMILYHNTHFIVRLTDGDIHIFDIATCIP